MLIRGEIIETEKDVYKFTRGKTIYADGSSYELLDYTLQTDDPTTLLSTIVNETIEDDLCRLESTEDLRINITLRLKKH